MRFFESLLVLLAAAVLLLQVSRRLKVPYPTMLAAAGVCFALVPGAPKISIEPHAALALFLAPVLVDAGFDFPIGDARKLWRPLFALAIVAVILSAGAVAWLGVTMAGLPIAAALVLGAIVAPPDAAAATAILTSVSLPRGSVAVLKGESLLNDASALLLFSAALAFQAQGGLAQQGRGIGHGIIVRSPNHQVNPADPGAIVRSRPSRAGPGQRATRPADKKKAPPKRGFRVQRMPPWIRTCTERRSRTGRRGP